MRTWWFPDNTVLCNFAAVDRLSLLEKVLDGRGRWTAAVAYEAGQSAHYLPRLRDLVHGDWLGDPVQIDDEAEQSEVERIRRAVFGGTPAQPTMHLGEAQTCVLILRRQDLREAVWITDDRDAGRFARRRGITTRETFDLMNEAVVGSLITAGEGHRLLQQMISAGRTLHRVSARPEDLLR